jgi:hypothetical protein
MTDIDPVSPAEPRTFASRPAESAAAPDALEVLRRDHETIARIRDEHARAADAVDKVTLAERLCLTVAVHGQIEEELFYPALRRAGLADARVDDAVVEHLTLKRLIADVESARLEDPLLDAKVRVLAELALRHADEEERDLFDAARRLGLDLVALGTRLSARKAELCREAAVNMKTRMRATGGPAAQMAAEHPTGAGLSVARPLRAAGAVAEMALTALPGGGRLRRILHPAGGARADQARVF